MNNPTLFDCHSVDLFAGGGGASEGIRLATGRAPLVAVNHDPGAIEMHARNHPGTLHLCESVFDVEPFLPHGRTIDLLWASPDCKHFSRAKGGKPRDKKIRALAWIVVTWAKQVRPRVICLENVPEFVTWGPLDESGRIIADRKGETFATFVQALQDIGYQVEHRVLVAADYGAPTTRRRLFLVARCDGRPIVWPEPSHGPQRSQPWRTAAECIDWSIPCPSIFTRKRPLAEATQRRIAEGLRRYVLEHPSPFIVSIDNQSNSVKSAVSELDEPLTTITSKARHTLVAPTLIQTGYGERKGQRPRCLDLKAPLGTVVAAGQKHALIAAWLTKFYGTTIGSPMSAPTPTVTAGGDKGGGHLGLVAAHITKFQQNSTGQGLDEPMHTVMAGAQRFGLVAAFLLKYYGSGGQWQALDEPLHTIVSKPRFGVVTITINGEEYAIADIGMRMLQPRELARAQGFSDDYVLLGNKSQQVAMVGRSVPPQVVEAIVRAQFGEASDPVRLAVAA